MFLILCSILVAWIANDAEAVCPPIIGKKEWDAVKPRHQNFLSTPVDLVVIQHTVTQTCSNDQSCTEIVRNLQKIHIEQSFLWDIAPSFLVGGTGKLYEGRGWHHVAVHTSGFNNQSIGIAFIGTFNNQDPSPKALDAVKDLIQCGVEEELLTKTHKVVVHNQLISTESPGKKLASKIMSWSDWTSDVSDIKNKADKKEFQPHQGSTTEMQSRMGKDLVLTSPKQIDLLSNLRDVIAELIDNMSKSAHLTLNTIEALVRGLNKEALLFTETIASKLKALRDQVGAAFSAITKIPGTQECAHTLRDKANNLYDNTEAKIKSCSDQRVKEIDDMVKNLGQLSSNAIDYTNTAVETTKNCTELNFGIELNTKACLNSATQQTKTASETYESQKNLALTSINSALTALPAALDLCAKKHLLDATTENTEIVSNIGECSVKNIVSLPGFGGFGR